MVFLRCALPKTQNKFKLKVAYLRFDLLLLNLYLCQSKDLITPQELSCHSIGIYLATILKGVKTEWVQIWANSIGFAIYAIKSKQTYQTSKTIIMMW